MVFCTSSHSPWLSKLLNGYECLFTFEKFSLWLPTFEFMCLHQASTETAQSTPWLFCTSAPVLASDISRKWWPNQWLYLSLFLCKVWPKAIQVCAYVLESGICRNCAVHPAVNTLVPEIFSLLDNFFLI